MESDENLTRELPVIIQTADVARVLGWRTERARRWLMRAGALRKRGGRWVTTRAILRESFPEIWDELAQRILDEDD